MTVDETIQANSRVLAALRRHDVRFAVIGGVAGSTYGISRPVRDLDLVVEPGDSLYAAVVDALGYEPKGSRSDFSMPGKQISLKRDGLSCDLLTSIHGLDFEEIMASAVSANLAGEELAVMSLEHLKLSKHVAGRESDFLDILELEGETDDA